MTPSSPESSRPAAIARWLVGRRPWARRLERLALLVERPVNRLTGAPQLNPFYHTGPIAVLLLGVVALTGFYLFLFFQYGFEASYTAVARLDAQPIARTLRAVHRYASGALVITTLLHAYRMLFMERLRGARWLAWVTGVLMTLIVWLAGVTGYWLLWDSRAQLINDSFRRFLERWTPWGNAWVVSLVTAEQSGRSWVVLLLLTLVHIGLFLLTAGFFWLHIRRLNRPRWLPDMHWVVGASVVLLLFSALLPAEILPPADPTRLPEPVVLDPIFLSYLAVSGRPLAGWLWGAAGLVTLWALALPWLSRRGESPPPPVRILADRCTGCTRCAQDCPYDALHMVEREDGARHKLVAVAQPDRCVSCGICLGACDDLAITLGETPPEAIRAAALQALQRCQAPAASQASPQSVKLIFTCERHTSQGAAPYLDGWRTEQAAVAVVALPCAGAVTPDLLPTLLAAGATEVAVVGCPFNDCANREGNIWAEQRLIHERNPRLRAAYDHAPITAAWLPPDEFERALPLTTPPAQPPARPDFLATRLMLRLLAPRNLAVGFILLGLVLLGQIWVTGLRFDPFPTRPAVVQLISPDPGWLFARAQTDWPAGKTWRMTLTVDDTVVMDEAYGPAGVAAGVPYFAEWRLSAGAHHLRWQLAAASPPITIVLADQDIVAAPGQIIRLLTPPQ